MNGDFETVYTVPDWWDGPRGGIADFNGLPHVYESVFDEAKDDWSDLFLLAPVDEETFRLALEDWAIWKRWEQAFHEGSAASETHPALPEDRHRHEELKSLLAGKLIIDPAKAITAKAEFRPRHNAEPGRGRKALDVKWTEAKDE